MNLSDTPLIFDIRRYSINDGPGIRLTIFFKGCPLRCFWCHNPEGLSPASELMYTAGRCILCGCCVSECSAGAIIREGATLKIRRELCNVCGNCTNVCPSGALELSGHYYTIEELTAEILKERVFFETSQEGGVTICGGEPLLYKNYLLNLLKSCKANGIHTAVDTSLYASRKSVVEVSDYTNLFLADLKLMDSRLHQLYTGVKNETILSNIKLLASRKSDFWIRIPLIEGVNDFNKNIEESAQFLDGFEWSRHINILTYHGVALSKSIRMGSDFGSRFREPSPETIERVIEIFNRYGFYPIIGG